MRRLLNMHSVLRTHLSKDSAGRQVRTKHISLVRFASPPHTTQSTPAKLSVHRKRHVSFALSFSTVRVSRATPSLLARLRKAMVRCRRASSLMRNSASASVSGAGGGAADGIEGARGSGGFGGECCIVLQQQSVRRQECPAARGSHRHSDNAREAIFAQHHRPHRSWARMALPLRPYVRGSRVLASHARR